MFETITNVAPFYTGWENYQDLFIPVIAPLTRRTTRLASRATPALNWRGAQPHHRRTR